MSSRFIRAFSGIAVGIVLLAVLGASQVATGQAVTQATATWTQLSPTGNIPSGRSGAMMAYDAATGQVVLFGGTNYGGVLNDDTWTWNGTNWTQQSPANVPPARQDATMAYDAATGQVVLFGGWGNGGPRSDTWTWDGTNWTEQSPANVPPARAGAMMAYDAATGQVVLFGGLDSSWYPVNDTWTWNGTNWTKQSPTTSPSARGYATMAYDAATGQVVLFGGFDSSGYVNDTWTGNGTNWTKQSPATSPSAKEVYSHMAYYTTMAYDAATGQMVLFFGSSDSALDVKQTWTWNGTNWAKQSPATSPSSVAPTMAYDAATGQMVLFGGEGIGGDLSDTWTLQPGPVNMGTANVCPSGASTPSPCSQSATVTYNVNSTTTFNAANPVKVLTQGAPNLDFTLSSNTCTGTVSASNTCTVTVQFAPRYPGQRMGEIELFDSSGNVLVSTNIFGTSTGPLTALTPGTISTVAGNGRQGYSGDGSAATGAQLSQPTDVAVDGAGNLYIADSENNVIRKVSASDGTISTVAGNGRGGRYSGDGGAATGAQLYNQFGVAVDGAGNLYIADSGNNVIRKVSASDGTISTVAGNNANGAGYSGDGGAATRAQLNFPWGVAVDGAGNLYIADWGNNVIRKVSASDGTISTVAGNGSAGNSGDGSAATRAQLSQPTGVAVDGAGNLYIADWGNNVIRKVSASDGTISTVAGNGGMGYSGDGGAATGAELSQPTDVAVDGAGNLYIADWGNNVIRKVSASDGTISTVAGNNASGAGYSGDGGAATSAQLNYPWGVAVDGAGNLYIADAHNNVIRKVNVSSASLTFASTPLGLPSSDSPQMVTLANIGNAALTFPVPASGNNPSIGNNFSLDSSGQTACPLVTSSSSSAGSLAGGASCTLTVSFFPQEAGSISTALTLTDTNLNAAAPSYAMQSISLSGTGMPDSTSTTVSASPNPVTVGQSVTITATVRDTSNSGTVERGGVTFVDAFGGTATFLNGGAAVPVSGGSASLSVTLSGVGQHAIVAYYEDVPGSWLPSDSSTTVTVSGQTVTATAGSYSGVYDGAAHTPSACVLTGANTGGLSCANTPATVGPNAGSGSITPSVMGSTGNFTITPVSGTYTISTAGSTVAVNCPASVVYSGTAQTPCTATVTGAGALNASLTPSYSNNINVGTASAMASYAGDANHTASSNSAQFAITQAAANIVLGNLTQTYDGQPKPVSVTAPGSYLLTYTGVNGTNYPQSAIAPTDPGTYTVVATVTDPNYVGGATGTLVINQLAPNLNLALLTGMPEPSIYGSTVYYGLSMAQTPCPTGQLQFYVDGQVASTLTLAGTSCTQPVYFQTAALTPGQHSVYAVYSGDTYYQGQTSGTVSHTVNADGTSVTLATSSNTVNVGQSTTFTATVSPTTTPDGSAQAPSGSVQFFDSGAPIGSGTLSTTSPYAATFSTTSLAAGSHSITATYTSADGLYTGSSSAVVVETVDKIVPVITWTPSATQFTYGTKITSDMLNATAASGGNTVNGTFTYDVSVGDVLPVGTRNVVVTFTPTDTATYASQSATVTFTVQAATLTVTADNQSRGYGAANPTLTYQITGFVNGDAQSVVSGTPNLTTTVAASSPVGSYAITVDVSGLTASNYTFTAVNGNLNVTQAALTVTADTQSMSYGTAVPALTGTLSGVISGDGITATYSTTATSASAPGTYSITPKLNGPNNKLSNYAVTSTNGTLTVNKAASNATIQTSASDVLAKANVTLTAKVSSTTSGTPTGSVAFMDGTASLGSATLDNTGTATLTINTLTAGTHSLTAAYGGDTDFNGISSAAVTETVQDFQFVINGGSTGSPVMTQTVKAGGIATYQFQMSPTGGTTFPSAVTLTLSGLPAGATYTITPASIAAGSGAQTVSIQVQTSKHMAALAKRRTGAPLLAFATLLPLFGMVRLRRAMLNPRKRAALLLLGVLVLGLLGMSACGGGNSQPQTYPMQLTASSGALQHTTTLVLTVQ
jgi:hypothetical protein